MEKPIYAAKWKISGEKKLSVSLELFHSHIRLTYFSEELLQSQGFRFCWHKLLHVWERACGAFTFHTPLWHKVMVETRKTKSIYDFLANFLVKTRFYYGWNIFFPRWFMACERDLNKIDNKLSVQCWATGLERLMFHARSTLEHSQPEKNQIPWKL